MLAALVAGGGSSVSVHRLIEAAWNGVVPATAVNLIQGHIVRLRRALGDPSGEVLRTHAPGYRLVLADGDLDSQLFERLVNEGTAALRHGDHTQASALLTKALVLWRGQAFADAPMSAAVEAEANRLEQLRLTALEARIDADLELGRHTAVVPELHTLVEAHQLRERFWGQLMLALYRSGRRADALATYQRLHGLLDTELGVEPITPIQELLQQILTDAAVDVPQVRPAQTTTVGVPQQLPTGIGDFTGRAEYLSRLDALIPDEDDAEQGAVVIVVVGGTAGVGKTSLSVHWAHRTARRFPDGQLYVNLRGFDPSGPAARPSDVVRDFLQCLGIPPDRITATLDAQVLQYRSLLADRRMLVVLDNAVDVDQVRPLLPGAPGNLVVVSSRNQLSGLVAVEGAHPITLDLLTVDEARRFLARRIGQARVDAEPHVVDEIIDRCAGLPLALGTVAARAVTHADFPLEALAMELRQAGGLDAFISSDASTDVRASFSWSYRALSPDAARLFRLLGLHPDRDLSVPVAAGLTGAPPHQVRPLLVELCRAHLVREYAPGRYTLHKLLHAYAAELAGVAGVDVTGVRNRPSRAV